MIVVVLTPEGVRDREQATVRELFASGLERLHLRKPGWSPDQLSRWLDALTPPEHGRIVVHGHPSLARRFGLLGTHWSDDANAPENPGRELGLRSRACHDLTSLRRACGNYDSVLVSPLFASLSKPGHGPTGQVDPDELLCFLRSRTDAERSTKVIGLGGIDATRVGVCAGMGLDGVAALGAVWKSPDPVAAFVDLRAAALVAAREPRQATAAMTETRVTRATPAL